MGGAVYGVADGVAVPAVRRCTVSAFPLHSSHSPDPPQAHLRCTGGSIFILESDHPCVIGPGAITRSAARSASCSNASSGFPTRRPAGAALVASILDAAALFLASTPCI